MSTQTKHTPGPWTADVCKTNTALSSVHSFGDRPELYRPWNISICCGPQAHENARLIAAAPDLLAALMELCADKYLADPINADRMAKARAAIAKAEGKA